MLNCWEVRWVFNWTATKIHMYVINNNINELHKKKIASMMNKRMPFKTFYWTWIVKKRASKALGWQIRQLTSGKCIWIWTSGPATINKDKLDSGSGSEDVKANHFCAITVCANYLEVHPRWPTCWYASSWDSDLSTLEHNFNTDRNVIKNIERLLFFLEQKYAHFKAL